MQRRDFITLLAGVAAWPLAARAQSRAIPAIGFVGSDSPELYADRLRAFGLGLRATGFIEGQNVSVEYRWAEGRNDRLPALMGDLVARQMAAIVATTTPSALAAKAATKAIPIIFFTVGDPVELGLVEKLNRPGGNLTGVTTLTAEVGPKRLEFLHEMVPSATTVALLVNPTNPTLVEAQMTDSQAAASILGLELRVLRASTDQDIESVFSSVMQMRAGGLVVSADSFFFSRGKVIADLAARHSMPAIYGFRESVVAGGLISYGGSFAESYRLVGVYTGQILKGERPADLPVQQSTKVELIINLKTAKALGLTVPLTLLGRADEVIE
jgi:putative ABC transport system substrate-binding protein